MSLKRSTQTLQNPPVVAPLSIEAPAVSISIQPFALSVADAARAVGCAEFTIADAIRARHLTAKKAGRHYVIEIAELRRWLADLEIAGS